MSVFGGDSWAREAQHRKRRLDDLMMPQHPSSSSFSSSPSYKKLSNGKYACLVCPNNPLLDSSLMLSMHNKGSRHIAAESRLRARELSIQEEINKRIALSSHSTGVSSSGTSIQRSKVHNKPLIEKTRKAILESQCNRLNELNSGDGCRNPKLSGASSPCIPKESPVCNQKIEASKNMRLNMPDSSEENSAWSTEAAGKMLADWHAELRNRQEEELKFTAAGWKRDCHGKWYRDENVEFDSDEEDPNVCLT